MKIKLLLLITTTVFSISNVNAYSSYGAKGCGSFVSAVDTTSERDKYAKDLNEMTVKSWIAGYVTSYNSWLDVISKKDNSNVLTSTDIDGVYMSILNYCKANPLHNINDAINDTLTQLQAQQKRKR